MKKCEGEITTFKELFTITKSYLDKLIKEYKNFKIARQPITNSYYNIYISYFFNKESSVIYYKTIYDLELDNSSNNIISVYKNILTNDNILKIYILSVKITVKLYNYNNFFLYDGEKQPYISNVCVCCKIYRPNVFITKCQHLVLCSDCCPGIFDCPHCGRKGIESKHLIFLSKEKSIVIDKSTSTEELI